MHHGAERGFCDEIKQEVVNVREKSPLSGRLQTTMAVRACAHEEQQQQIKTAREETCLFMCQAHCILLETQLSAGHWG